MSFSVTYFQFFSSKKNTKIIHLQKSHEGGKKKKKSKKVKENVKVLGFLYFIRKYHHHLRPYPSQTQNHRKKKMKSHQKSYHAST